MAKFNIIKLISILGLVVLGVSLPLMYTINPAFADGDCFWHLASGRLITELGHVPNQDRFSFSAGDTEWININWLSQIIFYYAYLLVGYQGLAFLAPLTLIAVGVFYFTFALRLKISPLIAMIFYFVIAASNSQLNLIRPQSLSLILFTVFCFLLVWPEVPKKLSNVTLILVCVLLVLWNQLHGACIFGYFLLGAKVLASILERDRRGVKPVITKQDGLLIVVVGVALLSFVFHPRGFKALYYIVFYGSHLDPEYFSTIYELQPFHTSLAEGPLMQAVLLCFAYLLLSGNIKLKIEAVIISVVLLILSFHSRRFIPFFYVYSLPFLALHVGHFISRRFRSLDFRWNYLSLGFVFLGPLFCAFNLFGYKLIPFTKEGYPIEIAEKLRNAEASEGQNVLVEYSPAGYFIWALEPKFKVFIDGRGDLHSGKSVYPDYMKMVELQKGWRDTLTERKIDFVLMRKDAKIISELLRDGWKNIYTDENFSYISRN